MVVMDVFTRRIIDFGVEPVDIDSVSVCRMFDKPNRTWASHGISVPITTRRIPSTDGKPICECLI